VLRIALVGLGRRRAQSLLTAAGVAIGVAAVVAFLSVAEGLERSARGLINLGGAQMGIFQAGVRDLTASTLPASLADRIEREPGVADATPVAVLSEDVRGESLLVFGVDPDGFVMRRLVLTEGRRPGPRGALLGDAAATDLGLGVGDTLQLDAGALEVTGTYHTGVPFEDQGVAVPLAAAQRDEQTAEATTIAVAVEPGVASSEVADRLERRFQGTIAIDQPGEATRADTNSLLLRKSTLVIAILALLLGGLTVVNTMAMAVLDRRAEFALLAAVGWSRPLVARLVVFEGLVLGALGVAVGLGLGALAGKAAADLLGAAAVVAPVTGAGVLALGAAIGLTLGALGAIYPAWRVTRVPAAEALA
jgi:putative ABC transport system permease protein